MLLVAVFVLTATACIAPGITDGVAEGDVGIINHTVSFETNGGSHVTDKIISKLTSAPITTRKNYAFEGWYLDESLTQAVVYPMEVKDDITLYAK